MTKMEPSPEQFTEWIETALRTHKDHPFAAPAFLFTLEPESFISTIVGEIARLACAAGADAELEACVEWLDTRYGWAFARHLRADRRPEPPSLKQQALKVLSQLSLEINEKDAAILANALASLPDD